MDYGWTRLSPAYIRLESMGKSWRKSKIWQTFQIEQCHSVIWGSRLQLKLKLNCFVLFIAAYISAWMSTSLSYVRRVELLMAVLLWVECFWLSICPILATVTARITRLCRNFFWLSKKPLVAWKDVCLSKSEEDLDSGTLNVGILHWLLDPYRT